MPIQQSGGSIADLLGQRRKASDTITSILNRETKPSVADIGRSASQTLMAINDPKLFKPATSQEVFEGRRQSELAPHIAMQGIADSGIKANEGEAKAIMESFGQFADNPEDLARLVQAAHEDPEPINASNAATFAARKAQELGLQSVKKMQAQAQMNYSLNKASPASKATPSAPAWLDSEQPRLISETPSDTMLQPPPVEGTDGGEPITDVVSINGRNVDISRFPSGVASAQDIGDRKQIRKTGMSLIASKEGQTALQAPTEAPLVLSRLDRAEQALKNIEAKGGKTGIAQGMIGKWLNNPDFEILNAVQSATAMAQRVPGTGAVSNFDAQQLLNQAPGGNLSPAANKLLLATMKAQFENARQYGDYYKWYANAFGTTDGLDAAWDQFRKDNPMVGKDVNGAPVRLPGSDVKWEDYFSGKAKPTPAASEKPISEMTDAELDALEAQLRGQ